METRASHLLIGSFVLLSIAGLFVFVIWLARVQVDREFTLYHIFFEGSVTGLSVGGDVRYRGIGVGTVSDIAISPEDPSRVQVTVELNGDTPIREADVASLRLQGVTGLSFINIEGAGADSPLIEPKDGELPVIKSVPSQIEQLVMSAPELLERGIALLERATEFLSEENRSSVTSILADVSALTRSLAGRSGEIEALIGSLERSGRELEAGLASLRGVAGNGQRIMDEVTRTLRVVNVTVARADSAIDNEFRRAFDDFGAASRSFGSVGDAAQSLLQENQESIQDFASGGLSQFSHLVNEARLLVAELTRITERIDSEGARFLLGDQQAEFEAGQ